MFILWKAERHYFATFLPHIFPLQRGSLTFDQNTRSRIANMERNIEVIMGLLKGRCDSMGSASEASAQGSVVAGDTRESWSWDNQRIWKMPTDLEKVRHGPGRKKKRGGPNKRVVQTNKVDNETDQLHSSVMGSSLESAQLFRTDSENDASRLGVPGVPGVPTNTLCPQSSINLLQAEAVASDPSKKVCIGLPTVHDNVSEEEEEELVEEEEEYEESEENCAAEGGSRLYAASSQRALGPPCLLLPESLEVTLLEGLVLLFSAWEAIFATYDAATYRFQTHPTPFEIAFTCTATLIYFIFIGINFNRARLIAWTLIDDDRPATIQYYIRHWMPFDFAVGFPVDLICLASGEVLGFRICQLVRVLKLVRSFSLFGTSNPLYDRRYSPSIAVVWIFFLHHVSACIHMAVKEKNENWSHYVDSLYWAVQTTTSVGYGDLEDNTTTKMQILSIVLMFVGSGFYGWFLGNISVYFMSQDHVEQKQKHMRSMLLSLMNRYEVPLSVQKEAFCIYPFIFGDGASSNFTEILNLFPPYMQMKIGVQVKLKLLRQVPMFKKAEEYILEKLAGKLNRLLLEPDTTIIEIDEVGKEMFFISSGAVEVLIRAGNTFKQIVLLRDGSWFGEIAILRESRRTAAVRTVTVCDLFMLTKDNFLGLVNEHPDSVFAKSITEEVDRRIRALGHDPTADKSSHAFLSKAPQINVTDPDAEGPEGAPLNRIQTMKHPAAVKDGCFNLDEFVSSDGSEDIEDAPVLSLV